MAQARIYKIKYLWNFLIDPSTTLLSLLGSIKMRWLKRFAVKNSYRAVLFKWEFIIQMRDAVSQPSLDIEESYFSKNTLFFFKNDFLFYYLKLYTPSVPLIWVFEAFFGPPFCSLTKRKEEKDGSSKVGSRGRSGSVCLAAALIWMINSHSNRTALNRFHMSIQHSQNISQIK